jgi:uncharacterized membrane protein required for colicin V production
MYWIDWVIVLVMGYGLFTGWMHGLVRTLLNVGALAAAFFLGPVLRPFAQTLIDLLMTGDPILKSWIATAVSYGGIYLALSIVGIVWSRFMAKGVIGTTDKIAGVLVGGALSALVLLIPLSLILAVPALATAPVVQRSMAQSKLLPMLKPAAPLFQGMVYGWMHPPKPSATPVQKPVPPAKKPPAKLPAGKSPAHR